MEQAENKVRSINMGDHDHSRQEEALKIVRTREFLISDIKSIEDGRYDIYDYIDELHFSVFGQIDAVADSIFELAEKLVKDSDFIRYGGPQKIHNAAWVIKGLLASWKKTELIMTHHNKECDAHAKRAAAENMSRQTG